MLESFELLNQDFPWVFVLAAFTMGAIVGSFLNVCIYRIPAERSVVFPGSTCACGQPIAWYHNIPILSWCLLRGRAACCGAKFSIRYPLIELLTAILFALSWKQHMPLVAIVGMLFIAFLICSTFIDLDHMIIPDRFSIGGMVIGVLISFAVPALHGIEPTGIPVIAHIESGVQAMIGALIGAGLVYWISVLGEIVFRKPAMGEGDVKFVGFIGAFCGWQGAAFAMFGGAFIGSAVLLPLLLAQRLLGRGESTEGDSPIEPVASSGEVGDAEVDDEDFVPMAGQVPFGPMLAVAGLIYFLGFHVYVDAYFAEVAQLFLAE